MSTHMLWVLNWKSDHTNRQQSGAVSLDLDNGIEHPLSESHQVDIHHFVCFSSTSIFMSEHHS